MRRALVLAISLAVLGACAATEDAVLEQARADFGCDHVVSRYLGTSRDEEFWIVEGCARIGHYRCNPELMGTRCVLIDARELPGQTAP
ncbi:MAG: hypothetical protein KIS78_03125 [Labilithrix sp.]|nr:hypothetical protein [Labilithrix sp.]MCW5831435.1 hypothetical protein [Labilithrix sp.]